MKFFDAFAGVGGFRLGMERAGHECVGGAEIDKYARAIYEHRFGQSEHHYGDVRAIDPARLPDFDVLCFGMPCQSHSIAGKRGGLSDPRGSLFFEVMRIARARKTPYLFLENVVGILSSDNGWAFWEILRAMDEIGMDVEWASLNTATHGGLPQNRDRVFLVGYLRNICRRKIFPLREGGPGDTEPHGATQGEGERLRTEHSIRPITGAIRPGARGARGSTLIELTHGLSDAHRIYDPEGVAKTLKGEAGGMGAKTGLYLIRKNMVGKGSDSKEEKYAACGDIASTLMQKPDHNPKVVCEPRIIQSNQRREIIVKYKSGAINRSMSSNQSPHVLTKDSRIRRLTPVECERLQGLPDNFTSEGVFNGKVKKISDSQRYKVCGNAVSVPVIERIARSL